MIRIACLAGLIMASCTSTDKILDATIGYDWKCQEIIDTQTNGKCSCSDSIQVSGDDEWLKKHETDDGEDTWYCEEDVDQTVNGYSSFSSLSTSTTKWIPTSSEEKSTFVPPPPFSNTDDGVAAISWSGQDSVIPALILISMIAII